MPHVVELDMRPEDFRLTHGTYPEQGHWPRKHPYGFGLLVEKLRMERPDLGVTLYRKQPEMVPYLKQMVDRLGLRAWPQPPTVKERARSILLLLRMAWALKWGSPLPHWQAV